jgi:hypothetical protein
MKFTHFAYYLRLVVEARSILRENSHLNDYDILHSNRYKGVV